MPRRSTLPITFAEFPPYDAAASFDAQIAIIGVPFDAHLDWVDERDGIREGFSSPMRRASEMPHVSSVVQIGLRGQGSARQKEINDADACSKSILIKAEDLHEQGVRKVLNRIPEARNRTALPDGL